MYEIDVLGLFLDKLRRHRLDLRIFAVSTMEVK